MRRKLKMIDAAGVLGTLRAPPGSAHDVEIVDYH